MAFHGVFASTTPGVDCADKRTVFLEMPLGMGGCLLAHAKVPSSCDCWTSRDDVCAGVCMIRLAFPRVGHW